MSKNQATSMQPAVEGTGEVEQIETQEADAEDSGNISNKKQTLRMLHCKVCLNSHQPPTGSKCPYGPPIVGGSSSATNSSTSTSGVSATSGGAVGVVQIDSETLLQFTGVLQNLTSRIENLEKKLDNPTTHVTAPPPNIPPVQRHISLTPTISDLKADRVLVAHAQQMTEDIAFTGAGNDVLNHRPLKR
jgi:hypothetical protein